MTQAKTPTLNVKGYQSYTDEYDFSGADLCNINRKNMLDNADIKNITSNQR